MMLKRVLSVALVVLCLADSVSALYGPKSDVILLTKKNFDNEVMNSNHVWIIEFFAPWCGHCKQLTPAWEQAAKKLKGIVKIAAIDADAEKELGGRFGIKGFPTIKVFGSPLALSTPQKKKTPTDYQGERTAAAIIAHATSLLPTKIVAKLTDEAKADAFLSGSSLPKVILFTEKSSPPPLVTALAIEFNDKIKFGIVRSNAQALCSRYGVTSFPRLLVFPEGAAEPVTYDGELKPDSLNKFLKGFAGAAAGGSAENEEKQEGKKEEKPKSKPQPKEDEGPVDVYELTSDASIEKYCVEQRALCLLAFLDPLADASSHEQYLATLKEVADKAKQSYRVVWVDVAKQPDFFAHFDPSDVPCLRVWNKKKQVVANVVAPMVADKINSFLKDVVSGRARSGKIENPPALVEGGVKYDIPEEEPFEEESQVKEAEENVVESVGKEEL